MKAEGNDIKAKAIIAAYATKDGKTVIDQFTGGKLPDVKDEKAVDAIFIGASEVLKVTRAAELSKTKTHDAVPQTPKGPVTAEQLNELHSKFCANRIVH
jgi:hypothetical protein